MNVTPISLEVRFWAFHEANPEVLDRLLEHAYKLRDAGQTRLSINMLFEIVRYERALITTGDTFKLNNDFRSRYVRMIQEIDPELGEMFETRTLKAA